MYMEMSCHHGDLILLVKEMNIIVHFCKELRSEKFGWLYEMRDQTNEIPTHARWEKALGIAQWSQEYKSWAAE